MNWADVFRISLVFLVANVFAFAALELNATRGMKYYYPDAAQDGPAANHCNAQLRSVETNVAPETEQEAAAKKQMISMHCANNGDPPKAQS